MPAQHLARLRPLVKPLLLAYAPAVVLFAIVFSQPRDMWSVLMADPAARYDLPFYSGLVSHVGVLLWVLSGSTAVFSAYAGRRLGRDPQRLRMLMHMGLFSLLLGLDDIFLLHEAALPSVGVPEVAVFGCYGLVLLTLLVVHRRTILDSVVGPLALAGASFFLSVVLDEGPEMGLPLLWRIGHTPLEDVFKLLGIVGWSFYLIHTGSRTVAPDA